MTNVRSSITKLEALELLKHFKDRLTNDSLEPIAFLKNRHKEKVLQSVTTLHGLFEAAKEKRGDEQQKSVKQNGKSANLSDYLDWHQVHEAGRELWTQLMSAAIADIDPNAKGHSALLKYLTAATEFEDLLYGLEPFYRDHTLHSLWVYLIGVKLMASGGELDSIAKKLNWYVYNDVQQERENPDPLVLWARLEERCFNHAIQKKRDAIWCVMALCHDLGYSLAKLEKLNAKVQAVLKFYDVSDFRHVGYTLDLEHQYLVTQCLELMAMDVRLTPGSGYPKDSAREVEEKLVNCIQRLSEETCIGQLLENGLERDTLRLLLMDAVSKMRPQNTSQQEATSDSEEMEEIEDLALSAYENVLTKCFRDDSSYWRLCKALEQKEHGVLSAYLLFKTMGLFADVSVRSPAEGWGLDDDEAVDNIIRGDILFGIAQHEFAFAHIEQMSSLAEILILCDELEEFSRLGRQLQSRKYYDTTAEASLTVRTCPEHEKDPCKTKVAIEMAYESRHQDQDEFRKFCHRKAERLCKLFSLGSSETKQYRIKEIKASFNYSENSGHHAVVFSMQEGGTVNIKVNKDEPIELECRNDDVYVMKDDSSLEEWLKARFLSEPMTGEE